MGYRSALGRVCFGGRQVVRSEESASTETDEATCDQAVFTSVRSPTGEGYRIIAASSGVRSNEKIEITRRSPSHGALCEDSESATGLASYVLSSGRHCVAYSCHAGREHTARGGARVYTHLVLLDRETFRKFGADPVRIHALVADKVKRDGPVLAIPDRFEPFFLPGCEHGAFGNEDLLPNRVPTDPEWVWAIANQLLSGRRLILVDALESKSLLQWSLFCVPRGVRESVDGSIGIKMSRHRKERLGFVTGDESRIRRQLVGEDVRLCRGDQLPEAAGSTYEGWFRLLRRWWQENRRAELVRFTTYVCADAASESLNRVAAIREDIDRVALADAETLETMLRQYNRAADRTATEKTLIEELLPAAKDRLTLLRSREADPNQTDDAAGGGATPAVDQELEKYRHRI